MPTRLAVFDNDGTLHPAKGVWSYLQKPLGLWEGEGRRILMDHLEGDLPYTAMVQQTIARWAGRPESEFLDVLRPLPLRAHALSALHTLRETGCKLVVLSSGIHWWEQVWREEHGLVFDRYHANVVEVDAAGICTGGVLIQVTDDAPETDKGNWVRACQAQWGITRAETIGFGDGSGDIPLFEACGRSWCIDPTDQRVVDAATDGELVTGDFAEWLQLWSKAATMGVEGIGRE